MMKRYRRYQKAGAKGQARPQMSAEEARHFEVFSAANAQAIKGQIPCDCEPYKDVFTFNRWKGQGYHVLKGEHGLRIDVYMSREVEDQATGGTKTIKTRARAVVFCRCQVEREEARG